MIHRLIEAGAKLQGNKGRGKVVNRIIEITPNEELFELMREVVDRMVEVTTPRYVQISESWRKVVKWLVELKIIHQLEAREGWRKVIQIEIPVNISSFFSLHTQQGE